MCAYWPALRECDLAAFQGGVAYLALGVALAHPKHRRRHVGLLVTHTHSHQS